MPATTVRLSDRLELVRELAALERQLRAHIAEVKRPLLDAAARFPGVTEKRCCHRSQLLTVGSVHTTDSVSCVYFEWHCPSYPTCEDEGEGGFVPLAWLEQEVDLS